jgi:hypothetical protein
MSNSVVVIDQNSIPAAMGDMSLFVNGKCVLDSQSSVLDAGAGLAEALDCRVLFHDMSELELAKYCAKKNGCYEQLEATIEEGGELDEFVQGYTDADVWAAYCGLAESSEQNSLGANSMINIRIVPEDANSDDSPASNLFSSVVNHVELDISIACKDLEGPDEISAFLEFCGDGQDLECELTTAIERRLRALKYDVTASDYAGYLVEVKISANDYAGHRPKIEAIIAEEANILATNYGMEEKLKAFLLA